MATILVVDDSRNIRQYLDTLLRRRNHQVLDAGTVTDALGLCARAKPDLIITDVLMPGSDGYEFVRQLRSAESLEAIPVIFFTGAYYQEDDARAFAEACGVALVLSKLSRPDVILDAVDEVLRKSLPSQPKLPDPEFDRGHARVLTDKLYANVKELELSNAQLRVSEDQLHQLAGRLRSAQEDERTRIARQLHDELGQALTLLKMNCTWIASRLQGAGLVLPAGVADRLQASVQVADRTIQTVRRLATELRPGILDLGLSAAIEWQTGEFQRNSEIPCTTDLCETYGILEPTVATELFRIFQETLTNILRHANATRVQISLRREGAALVLEVRDNGRGITEAEIADPSALGLLGMRERTVLAGGKFSIGGKTGAGTTVRIQVPMDSGNERVPAG